MSSPFEQQSSLGFDSPQCIPQDGQNVCFDLETFSWSNCSSPLLLISQEPSQCMNNQYFPNNQFIFNSSDYHQEQKEQSKRAKQCRVYDGIYYKQQYEDFKPHIMKRAQICNSLYDFNLNSGQDQDILSDRQDITQLLSSQAIFQVQSASQSSSNGQSEQATYTQVQQSINPLRVNAKEENQVRKVKRRYKMLSQSQKNAIYLTSKKFGLKETGKRFKSIENRTIKRIYESKAQRKKGSGKKCKDEKLQAFIFKVLRYITYQKGFKLKQPYVKIALRLKQLDLSNFSSGFLGSKIQRFRRFYQSRPMIKISSALSNAYKEDIDLRLDGKIKKFS